MRGERSRGAVCGGTSVCGWRSSNHWRFCPFARSNLQPRGRSTCTARTPQEGRARATACATVMWARNLRPSGPVTAGTGAAMSTSISSRRTMTLLMLDFRWKGTVGLTFRGPVAAGTFVKRSLPRKIGPWSVEFNHRKVWGADSLKEGILWLRCFLQSKVERHVIGSTDIVVINRP